MSEYIRCLGAAVVLGALMEMIIPDGDFKKYCRVVCGLAVVAVALRPITGNRTLELTQSFIDGGAVDTEAAELQARARVLTAHKSNLEGIVEKEFPGCGARIEVDNEGNVTRLTVNASADLAAVTEYAERELGLKEGDVRVNEEAERAD